MSQLDVEKLKADFPILSRQVHGKRLVYLDSAASAQKPRQVLDAMDTFQETSYANVHRGVYEIAVEADDSVLNVDRVRLEQALSNLVDNALRHGAGKVTLSSRAASGTVELHVADQGPGFAPGTADRAFERFTRGDTARGRGGTGLGLAIVRTIATAHGGSAGITATPAGGADVWLTAPAA